MAKKLDHVPADVKTAKHTSPLYDLGTECEDDDFIYRYVQVTKTGSTTIAAGKIVYENTAGQWDCVTDNTSSCTVDRPAGVLCVTDSTTSAIYTWVIRKGLLSDTTTPALSAFGSTTIGYALGCGTVGVMGVSGAVTTYPVAYAMHATTTAMVNIP